MAKQKIVYYHNGLSSFVKKDIAILEEEFDLTVYHFVQTKRQLIFSFINQFLKILRHGFSVNVIVVQFAGFHSFLPVLLSFLFRYKTVIVLGGTDTVSFPSIRYGSFHNKNMRFFTQFSIRHASHLSPVSKTLVHYTYTYQSNDFPAQGYKAFIQKSTPSYTVIPNGYDDTKWFIDEKEPGTFVTIAANLSTRFGYLLKGIDLIVEVAAAHPDFSFYIVGGETLSATIEIPKNVHLLGLMSHAKLAVFLSKKSFYLQLSMSEGFPNALCEGMLSGCVPIGSNVGAISEIIGDSGYILRKKDPEELSKLLNFAFENYALDQSLSARNRISENYTLQLRRDQLIQLIQQF